MSQTLNWQIGEQYRAASGIVYTIQALEENKFSATDIRGDLVVFDLKGNSENGQRLINRVSGKWQGL